MKNIDNFINELVRVCQNNGIDIDRLITELGFNKEMNQDVLMYIISGMEQNKKLR